MGTPPLSPRTEERVALLFAPEFRDEARRMLCEECGNNLPFLHQADAMQMERFRFAALKVSGGRLEKLREAIALARIDWRDLLVWAEFASDPEAHLQWMPVRCW